MRFEALCESILAESQMDDAVARLRMGEPDRAIVKKAFAEGGSKAGHIQFLLKDENFRKDGVWKAPFEFREAEEFAGEEGHQRLRDL